jgi:hypothetical protein
MGMEGDGAGTKLPEKDRSVGRATLFSKLSSAQAPDGPADDGVGYQIAVKDGLVPHVVSLLSKQKVDPGEERI